MILFYVIVEFLSIYLVEVALAGSTGGILIVGVCSCGFGLMCYGFGCCLLMLLGLGRIGLRCISKKLLVIYIIFESPSYSPPITSPSSPHTSTPSPHPQPQSPSPYHLHPPQKQIHWKHKSK